MVNLTFPNFRSFRIKDFSILLNPRFQQFILIFIIVFFWLLDFASKYKFQGLVYGLNYGLYHPDGSLYTFRTLTFLGYSQFEAANLVSDWYSSHAFKLQFFEPSTLYFDTNPQWDRFLPRILYPLLSVPFVAIFGISGMLAIPALSMLGLMLVILKIGNVLENRKVALLFAILLSFSPTVNRWMFANTADSLLTFLVALIVLVLLSDAHGKRWWLFMFSLLVVTSYTRVVLLVWLAVAFVMFLNKFRVKSLFLLITASLLFIPAAYKNTETAILPNESEMNFISKILLFPKSIVKVGFFEVAQLAVLDRFFLATLVVGIYLAFFNLKKSSSQYFLLVFIGLWLTAAVNGTVGVNFRYELPILVFLGWVWVDNFRFSRTT